MSSFFVDRIELKNDLFELLDKTQFNNTVFMLSSRSGLGKSAFCKQIIEHTSNKYPSLKISIPVGENISLDEGYYFREIARIMSAHSTNYNYQSLNEFLQTTDNALIKKIMFHKIADDSKEIHGLIKPINSLLSYLDHTGDFSESGLLDVNDSKYIYIVLREYILFCCRSQPKVIINIENVQHIDKLSLIQLQEILKKTDNLFLLLEYTSKADSLNEAKQFEENFQIDHTEVITRRLEKLSYDYTCEIINHICPSNRYLSDRAALKEIYFTIDGNIRQLSDIESMFELQKDEPLINTSENFTAQRLKILNNAHEIQLICLVYSHMSQTPNEILKLLLSNESYIMFVQYDKILSSLMGPHGLLDYDISTNTIKLKHDSIRTEIKNIPKFEAKISLSYSWWIRFYEKALNEANDTDWMAIKEIVKKLCYFYCHHEPAANKIINLLPHIRKIAINSVNPDEAISFLMSFYNTFSKMNDSVYINQLNKFLLNIYYELGIFDKSYSFFKNISFKAEKTSKLYQAMLLDRLQREHESIQIIDVELKNTVDEHYKLVLYLIKMIAAASSNQYDECTRIFGHIYDNKNIYSKYFEYGFFLRNSEIVLALREAIPYLNESIDFFDKRGEHIYEAHARISLLMNCARVGIFDEAKKQIEITKSLLKNNTLEHHILLNDEVAYEMCRGNYSQSLENDLKLAMCTAQVVFDKIIINHNLLILYRKNNQFKEGEELVEYLLELIELETNQLNICFTYWNISFFYKNYEEEQYQYYYNKYLTLYNTLISRPIRISVVETDVFHKPNNECVIGFISYWRFPIPEDL